VRRFALGAFFAWFAITVTWWTLAFAPLAAPPAWLERTRAVCFGTLPNGLPDTWGWMLLLLGPLSLLSFLVAVWGADLADGLARLACRATGWMLLAPLVLTLGGGIFWVGDRVAAATRAASVFGEENAEPLPAAYPRGSDPAPPLPLVDQHGTAFDLAALRGHPVLLTFAYGHCQIVCPALVHRLRAAFQAWPGSPPGLVVVTLDPWRDTPGALPSLARTWKLDTLPGARVLSGPVATVEAVIHAYGIGAARDETTGDITHPGLILVLDSEGRVAYRFLDPPVAWLVEAVRRLERPGA
jgi:cytochrome oxidase Cu insertion factor (SCO1/SenC/PrrC family)